MASENNTGSTETAELPGRCDGSQNKEGRYADKESGETEPKIPKTGCAEGDRNGAALPTCLQEDGDAASLVDVIEDPVPLVIIFNKKKHDVSLPLSAKMAALRLEIQRLTGVPPAMQKLIYKGAPKLDDAKTLRELGLSSGCKLMLVGSTLDDVLNLEVPPPEQLKDDKPQATKEPICKQKLHQKVLDKGVPEDAIPGIRNAKDSLPDVPLSGMVNKSGGKVRLTFKLELDQIWIGTKERTEKINMSSIKQVISEAIEGHEEYHIMALQLGTTEASRYWIYWVPAQYVDAIRDTILGK
ncbi:hypothetical protein HPB47_024528 [Ixodes persulcatus]|uniref:Uncharacterized protein n=1 Tax=Ixodes persulcatus TaxID=34615 RepID=A0AC60Q4J0_IXOPE|nr:hypothetical protein HPB47_024528 [Ixodes persulcatus]